MHIDTFSYSKCSLQGAGNGIYLSPWNADKYFSAPTSLPVQPLPFLRMQIKNDPRFIYISYSLKRLNGKRREIQFYNFEKKVKGMKGEIIFFFSEGVSNL